MLEQHAVEQFFNHHALVAVQLGQCFKAQAQIRPGPRSLFANTRLSRLTCSALASRIRLLRWVVPSPPRSGESGFTCNPPLRQSLLREIGRFAQLDQTCWEVHGQKAGKCNAMTVDPHSEKD